MFGSLLIVILVITIVYYFLKKNYKYWETRGVQGPKPTLLVGNVGQALLLRTSAGQIYTDIYNEYKDEELVGLYRTITPVLLVRDLELIREVTEKSFSYFEDNEFHVDKNNDLLFGRNVFSLKGKEWRETRSHITPGFSSWKIKLMYNKLVESAFQLVDFIKVRSEVTSREGYDVKELATRYMLNNVASCGFGLEGKCLEEDESEFRKLGNDFFTRGNWTTISFTLINLFPQITRILNFRFVTKKLEDKMIETVNQTIKNRVESNIVFNDFLNTMIQLKRTIKDISEIDIVAHTASFFFQGYELNSHVLAFILFELAQNPVIQEELRTEVRNVFDANDRDLPYDAIQMMPYLEAVINETLRLHSPFLYLQKVCTKTFTFPSRRGKPGVTVEKGTPIILPMQGLHHDPKYFEDPEVFKPERFLGQNKNNLTKKAFIPFGAGPRNCLGQRFAMLQTKMAVACILNNFEVSIHEKTVLPLKYDPLNFLTAPANDIFLNFEEKTVDNNL